MVVERLEIYIHIPFCVNKCDYCDFLSMSAENDTIKTYISALINEMKLSKNRMKGYLVDTVFIGGGTPSILEEKYIDRIMEVLRENCIVDEDAEITIECNPGTVDKNKLNSFRRAGINRISFGLQSANDNELRAIGRIHNFSQFQESFSFAREVGFDNINVDIMSALPNQTVEAYTKTLEKVLELNPEHISAYSLIVEDGTPLYYRVKEAGDRGISILPDEDSEREMYYQTEKILQQNHYERYEISNYARNGFACKHNIGYWKRREYLGFGIGAASLYKGKRFNNVADIQNYIDTFGFIKKAEIPEVLLTKVEENLHCLSKKEQMEEFMFLGLRMMEGISIQEFERQFGAHFTSIYGKVVERFIEKGLLEKKKGYVRLTKRGIDISNYVMSEFLL